MTRNELTGAYGSSPLARGTRARFAARLVAARFIPAGAGNTDEVLRERICAAVHPRWRGEHINHIGTPGAVGGSSPLARGTQPYRR